ncbi:ABC transporter permease [Streptomyces sp. NTH33]|uniref:ABC transporter permease n=1 Tax=Streptomyces sp. NTH33 TaxID=1735453 RepID=UPI000DB63AAA|nr:ABC transporter permease [Streptomyces sp. NTH33]PZH16290.1 ABC transporter permease [Streptomyces sp. NTH33]
MIGCLRAEFLSVRKRPGVWIVGGAWVALAVAFGMAVPYIVYLSFKGGSSSGSDPEDLITSLLPDQFMTSVVGLYPMFGSALMLVFGAVVAGGDHRWGTWGTLFVQGTGRITVMAAKSVVTAVALLCVTAAVVAATAAVSALIAFADGRPVHWPPTVELLKGFGVAWLVSMAAVALGTFLAVLFRNTGAAIGVGLVWLLALENLVSGVVGTLPALEAVQRVLLGANGGSLAAALGSSTQDAGGTPGVVAVSGPLTASFVLAGYVVVFLGLSTMLVSRRDVP